MGFRRWQAPALDRLLPQRLGGANLVTAVDMNPFYLKEAEALAAEGGLAGTIRFLPRGDRHRTPRAR